MTIIINTIRIVFLLIYITNFSIHQKPVNLEASKEKSGGAGLIQNFDKSIFSKDTSQNQLTANIENKSLQIAKQTPVPIVSPPPTNINTKRILIGLGILPILIVLIGLLINNHKKYKKNQE